MDTEVNAPLGKIYHSCISTKIKCGAIPGYSYTEKLRWSFLTNDKIESIGANLDWSADTKNIEELWDKLFQNIKEITSHVPKQKTRVYPNRYQTSVGY